MTGILKYLIKLQADQGNVLSVARGIASDLDTLTRKAVTAGASIKKAFSFDNFKQSLKSIPGMEFLLNPYTLIAGGLGAIAKLGSEAEMTSTAFNVLVGSEEQASKVLSEINQFAAHTPFNNLELTDNAQQMLSFGVESNKVTGYLKQLGDISGGNSEKLSSLSLVFGQVSAAGKLSGQDLMQFINAGWNPLLELAEMTGKDYKEMQDLMSKGAVSSDHLAAAMAHATGEGGRFHGMMEATSQTLSGKVSTLIGNIQQKAVDFYHKIEPALKGIVDIANAMIPPIAAVFDTLFSVIATVIGWVVKFKLEFGLLASVIAVGTVVFNAHKIALMMCVGVMKGVALVTKGWTAAQWLLNVAMNANPIGLVITGIAALIAIVVACWNRFAGFRAFLLTMWDVMKGFGDIIKTFIIDRLQGMLTGLGKIGEALSKLFHGDFKGGWEAAKSGVKGLMGVDAATKAAKSIAGTWQSSWSKNLTEQNAKTGKKKTGASTIATPGLTGSSPLNFNTPGGEDGGGGKGGGSNRVGDAIATGGTRNSTINISIGKFFDSINVQMADKADTAELERTVLECMNRALAIATSSDR